MDMSSLEMKGVEEANKKQEKEKGKKKSSKKSKKKEQNAQATGGGSFDLASMLEGMDHLSGLDLEKNLNFGPGGKMEALGLGEIKNREVQNRFRYWNPLMFRLILLQWFPFVQLIEFLQKKY